MKLNLPNKLTLFRILMVPVFLAVMLALPLSDTVSRIVSGAVFILTCVTDMLDGKIARKYNLVTDFGKFMDPLADKFIVFAALLAILVKYDYLRDIFVWAAALVMFRELAVTSMRLVVAGKDGTVIAANLLGKIKTVSQIVCISTIILEPVVLPLYPFRDLHILSYATMAFMTVMTVWSGVNYIASYWKYLSPEN